MNEENNELFDFADSDISIDEEVEEEFIDKKEEKRRLKEQKKADRELIKNEKREIRKVKNAERKVRIVFISKVLLTVFIVLAVGFLNALTFTLLGFTRLSMLFVLPSIFIIMGLFIPLIWVKKGSKGLFLTIWLICVLTYIIGLALPIFVFEYNSIALAVRTVFEWVGGLFG